VEFIKLPSFPHKWVSMINRSRGWPWAFTRTKGPQLEKTLTVASRFYPEA